MLSKSKKRIWVTFTIDQLRRLEKEAKAQKSGAAVLVRKIVVRYFDEVDIKRSTRS
jgi:hypothetical protein